VAYRTYKCLQITFACCSDVFCGLLHCNVNFTAFSQLSLKYPGTPTIFPSRLITNNGDFVYSFCTSGYYWNGDPSLPDAGYVPNGASCGTNQVGGRTRLRGTTPALQKRREPLTSYCPSDKWHHLLRYAQIIL
jgi:hypothetical protein